VWGAWTNTSGFDRSAGSRSATPTEGRRPEGVGAMDGGHPSHPLRHINKKPRPRRGFPLMLHRAIPSATRPVASSSL
jgi:hypothetical protein